MKRKPKSVVAENIKSLRQRNGLSQEELADELKVSPTTISRWENDKTDITYFNLDTIAHFFGITVEDLTGGMENKTVNVKSRSYKSPSKPVPEDTENIWSEVFRKLNIPTKDT